jgi:hypothetical protein
MIQAIHINVFGCARNFDERLGATAFLFCGQIAQWPAIFIVTTILFRVSLHDSGLPYIDVNVTMAVLEISTATAVLWSNPMGEAAQRLPVAAV